MRVQPELTITHTNWEWIIVLFKRESTCTSCSKLYLDPLHIHFENAKKRPPICWIICTKDICSRVSIDTHAWYSINTPLAPHLTVHWHLGRELVGSRLILDCFMRASTSGRLSTECWSSVSQVLTKYWVSSTDKDVDWGYELRVLTDTQPQIPN